MSNDLDFLSVTELSGDDVTQEQIDRLCNRYYWAARYCAGKDVLEVACGTGQGSGYLSKISKTYQAGDYSSSILSIARKHYNNRIDFKQFDAQNLPFADKTFDVVILFEAIYYLSSAEKFVSECRRVLRDNGQVLIATANKDLYDFNPSPNSYKYYGVIEMRELFEKFDFYVKFYGNTPIDSISLRQKLLRPVKKVAVELGLVPKSMAGKKLLKKLVFGSLVKMPAELTADMVDHIEPVEIPSDQANERNKVIYCVATLKA